MDNNTNITIEVRSLCGIELNYPICKKDLLPTELRGKEIFTSKDLNLLKQLGYNLTFIQKDL